LILPDLKNSNTNPFALPHGANTWLPLQDGPMKGEVFDGFWVRKLTSLWDDKFQPRTSQQHHSRAQKPPPAKITFELFISKFQNNEKNHPSIYPFVIVIQHLDLKSAMWCSWRTIRRRLPNQDPAARPAPRRCFFGTDTS